MAVFPWLGVLKRVSGSGVLDALCGDRKPLFGPDPDPTLRIFSVGPGLLFVLKSWMGTILKKPPISRFYHPGRIAVKFHPAAFQIRYGFFKSNAFYGLPNNFGHDKDDFLASISDLNKGLLRFFKKRQSYTPKL
jgi:hypothetical protein